MIAGTTCKILATGKNIQQVSAARRSYLVSHLRLCRCSLKCTTCIKIYILLYMTQYIWSLSCRQIPGVQVGVRSAQFCRQHEACWHLVKSRLIRKFLLKLEYIFCSVQEMESLVPGWSVPLRRWPPCQWWRAEWQPRSTLCQSSSLLGPSFQFPLFRKKGRDLKISKISWRKKS